LLFMFIFYINQAHELLRGKLYLVI
jgi:hypothetical protein